MVLIKIVETAIKLAAKYAYPVSRGLANVEKPAFNYAYRGGGFTRWVKKPIYQGYKAGTVIGLAGDAILDALLSESDVPETSPVGKTRDNMVKSRTKRKYNPSDKPYCYSPRRPYNRYSNPYRKYR